MKRRDFLKSGLAFLTSAAVPQLSNAKIQNNPESKRRLLLIELKGGNDGLNTLIPYSDPLYYKLRPQIAIPRDQVLTLDQQMGLHPSLESFMPLWKNNELAIMQGVGYENQNRSHFRSIEIWETASRSDQYLDQGWLASSLKASSNPRNVADAIAIGKASQGGINGLGVRSLVIDKPENFQRRAMRLKSSDMQTSNPALAHLLNIQNQVTSSASKLSKDSDRQSSKRKVGFKNDIHQAAKLLSSKQAPQVVKVSLGSFDTHANQLGKHARLLTQLAEGISEFKQAMLQAGLWQDTLIMTYSEFGRRAKQNGSKGTDHGTAAPHFITGGTVRGGLYGRQPSLSDLSNNDLKYNLGFHQIYSSIKKEWWQQSGKELGIIM